MRTLILFAVFLSLSAANAVDFKGPPGQLRFFIGTQNSALKQVNEQLEAAGIEKFTTISTFGLEGTYQVLSRLSVGVRGVGKWQKVKEKANPPVDPANPYNISIQQSAALLVLRADVFRSQVFRFDIFAAGGTATTTMSGNTPIGDGKYTRSMSSMVSEAGASLGVGWSNIYFLVEAGNEWNKVGNLTRSGATTTAIDEIDLSGAFVTVGILFNGLPSWIKAK